MTIHLRLSLRLDVSAKGQDWSGADGGPYGVYLAAGHIFGSRYLRVEVRRLRLAKNDLCQPGMTEKETILSHIALKHQKLGNEI